MPFVTKELWQRLPRRPNDSTPSIMVSSYPVFVSSAPPFFSNFACLMLLAESSVRISDPDKRFNLVFTALRAGRSLAASYNMQTHVQREWTEFLSFSGPFVTCVLVFLHIQSHDEAVLFETQTPAIVALTKGCKSARVVRDVREIPAGCGSAVVTPTIVIHTLVKVKCHRPAAGTHADSSYDRGW
jgi:valyl-tRNA synthetase